MLDSHGVAKYWEEQTKKGDNPCHYHNKWQDQYAFLVRTGAFKKNDFRDAKKIVDVGCGIGEYTNTFAKLTTAHFDAFDFPFNIEIAEKTYPDHPQITFYPHAVPHESVRDAIQTADCVITTTVYVHFSEEAKTAFTEYIRTMKKGAKVMLLEYIPHTIPDFQKNLTYKHVETVEEIRHRLDAVGFALNEVRHVNFIDSFFFHHLGAHVVSYYLTRWVEMLLSLVGYTKSKYKMLVFEKRA